MELSHLLAIGLPVKGLAGASGRASPQAAPAPAAAPAAAPGKGAAASAQAQAKPPPAKVASEGKAGAAAGEGGARHMQPANALPGPAAQKTRQLYLDNTYLFEHAATVLDVWDDGDKVCVELDQTIFHPQGGGQPSDVGLISAEGLADLEVLFVQMDKARQGVIRHDCKGDLGAWRAAAAAKKPVICKVDGEKRRLFARLHSAGHLLDVAMHDLGFLWRPGKGYHFPDGPYVEYAMCEEGRQLDNKDPKAKEAAISELMARMTELVARSGKCHVEWLDGVRTVTFEDVSCGCGGTHVPNTGDIGEVVVKKLQAKQGNMRVSYTLK